MNKDIEGVELTVYYHNGDNISVNLSPTQLMAVSKILGLEMNEDDSFTCFSDESVKQLMDLTINRFKKS